MKRRLREDLRAEAAFLPRVAATVLAFYLIQSLLPSDATDFWAALVFLGEFLLALALTWLLFAVLVVRPRLTIVWHDSVGRELKGRSQTLEYSPGRQTREYQLEVRYEQPAPLASRLGKAIAECSDEIMIRCIPDMASLFVDSSSTGATRNGDEGVAIPLSSGGSVFDSVTISIVPKPSPTVTPVRFVPGLKCDHRWSWHEMLLVTRQNVDSFDLIYNERELR